MNKYLLDSNILIDYLRRYPIGEKFLKQLLSDPQFIVAISGITELEIYAGKRLDNPEEAQRVNNFG